MTPVLLILCVALLVTTILFYDRSKKTKLWAQQEVEASRLEAKQAQVRYDEAVQACKAAADKALRRAEQRINEKLQSLEGESEIIRAHYEAEARKAEEAITQRLAEALGELEALRPYRELQNSEAEVRQRLADSLTEIEKLHQEAVALMEAAKEQSLKDRAEARQRAKEIMEHAEAVLTEASKEARRITDDAEQKAVGIGGDAYRSLREKEALEQAVTAIHNVVEGYGDRYIIPTRSLLDDLAEDFGHTEAGVSLRTARERTRVMVRSGEAAACDYVENARKATAIRFVIDAFNGRVDAILSRVKHDNYGTLAQEIRDSYSLVNLNGEAFRNARIHPAYLDSRLNELKWAVVAQELKLKEREEQRRIQEQIREEERARKDYERALREAAREEELLRQAMEKARAEAEKASAGDKAAFEQKLADLQKQLTEAEAKNQRALSMAQQTKAGHVYIISNHGSFGFDVLKIGMTRRLEPMERVYELGDASVPFPFDVHAMIYSEDAPGLERLLHKEFDEFRVNKVNYRKEFFRVTLECIRQLAAEKELQVSFTMMAEARDYRETLALERMSQSERERYQSKWQEADTLSPDLE